MSEMRSTITTAREASLGLVPYLNLSLTSRIHEDLSNTNLVRVNVVARLLKYICAPGMDLVSISHLEHSFKLAMILFQCCE